MTRTELASLAVRVSLRRDSFTVDVRQALRQLARHLAEHHGAAGFSWKQYMPVYGEGAPVRLVVKDLVVIPRSDDQWPRKMTLAQDALGDKFLLAFPREVLGLLWTGPVQVSVFAEGSIVVEMVDVAAEEA